MARPRIEIDENQFKKLCAIQCTEEEIASWFKCSVDTIERWCHRELKLSFAEAFKTFSADGKISLRRTQFKMAETNCSMAIWLGKQYLGQREAQEISIAKTDDDSLKQMEAYFARRKSEDEQTRGA